jgi:CSLREA domain-containing protein
MPRTPSRGVAPAASILLSFCACALFLADPAPAHALVYTVDSVADERDAVPGDGLCASGSGACTLRAALEESSADTSTYDQDHVILPPGHYVLTLGALSVAGTVVLGTDPGSTVIDAQGRSRVIEVRSRPNASDSAIAFVTIQNGAGVNAVGAGIMAADANVRFALLDCVVRNNTVESGAGGAIYSAGNLSISRSLFMNNRALHGADASLASGGAIYHTGDSSTLQIEKSAFLDNYAARGGAIAVEYGSAAIHATTFARNRADARGGAIFNRGHSTHRFTISTSTIAENVVGDDVVIDPELSLGGGIYSAGNLTLRATILARNNDSRTLQDPLYAPDLYSDHTNNSLLRTESKGYLLLGVHNAAASLVRHTSDIIGPNNVPLDAGLQSQPSTDADEVTLALALTANSAAADVIPQQDCTDQDQWSYTRSDATCDIGAIERESAARTGIRALYIVGDAALLGGDAVFAAALRVQNYGVAVRTPAQLSEPAGDFDMIVISESVESAQLPAWLVNVPVPILCMEPAFLDELGMTGPTWDVDQGAALEQQTLRYYAADGSTSDRVVTKRGSKFGWGVPATADATRIAELAAEPGHWAVFSYAQGARLAGNRPAPARRTAYYAAVNAAQNLTPLALSDFSNVVTDLLQ